MSKSVWIMIVIVFLLPAGRVSAFYGSIEATAGYDDNANSDFDAKETWFAYFGAQAGKEFEVFSTGILDMYAGGSHQSRFSLDDASHMSGGGSLSLTMAEGRVLSGIFADGAVYRDGLNIDDEGEQVRLGARIDWIASGRLTLGFEAGVSWFYYREPVETVEMAPLRPDMPPMPEIREVDRDDRCMWYWVQGVYYFSPDLQLAPGIRYEKCTSSIKEESGNTFGFETTLVWTPDDLWQITAEHVWERTRDDFAPVGEKKQKEIEQSLSAQVSRFVGDIEIYLKGGWTRNEIRNENESYTQRIGQCGVVYGF